MIDFKKYMPSKVDESFFAKTPYGTRIVSYNSMMQFFRYEDCTHPMQNCYCNPFDITEWEYVDKQKMEQLLFEESWVGKRIRQEQADEMPKNIKPSLWDGIFFKINHFQRKLKLKTKW
jgi:hypothetical protein